MIIQYSEDYFHVVIRILFNKIQASPNCYIPCTRQRISENAGFFLAISSLSPYGFVAEDSKEKAVAKSGYILYNK